MKSAQTFSKFNFRKVGNAASKALKRLKKRDVVKLIDTFVHAVRYYLKSNNTLYKKCFCTLSKYTLAQWGVIFGVGTPSKAIK